MSEGLLAGKHVLVTRAKSQSHELSAKIKEAGGIPVEVPLLSFQQPDDLTAIKKAISQLDSYDWLVFTSVNGIRFFFSILHTYQYDLNDYDHLKIAVVGNKTQAELERFGSNADLVPPSFVAESLLRSLKEVLGRGERVLFPKGNLARSVIPDGLKIEGFVVTEIDVYETVRADASKLRLRQVLETRQLDLITFTSSSTVNHFVQLLNDHQEWRSYIEGVEIAAIGPITADTLMANGLHPEIVANTYTIDGLMEAIHNYLKGE
ncbi:uroporphyrinogen-III synthase [Desertibacillus haloalkaliphilus]|uniref:uroporphyrinogen-III synthase n=1 Tax=Desertibacillus haloalkaliphilus TaxID=1328930 RepID=UPI001C27BEFD|nr:uroporphyrinogen-III synthase [Desertibacillus haloalkaliphilus]MBU8905067.1 uroporphyrinogen-III synthase [Desertibacillus haloalkaliphilus]